jgi:hypothetical protein
MSINRQGSKSYTLMSCLVASAFRGAWQARVRFDPVLPDSGMPKGVNDTLFTDCTMSKYHRFLLRHTQTAKWTAIICETL